MHMALQQINDMTISKFDKHKQNLFIIMMVVLLVLIFFLNYDGDIDSYNTTILALNYSYGFTSRGLIGTLFSGIAKLLPIDIMNPMGAKLFILVWTLIFCIVLLIFVSYVIKKCRNNDSGALFIMMMYLIVALSSTYISGWNLGRVDIYMIMASLICVMLLIKEKAEWLVIPITAIAVMIHQGYVLMYLNIVIACLLYRIITDKSKRVKLIIILAITVVACFALLLYFELFAHADNGMAVYETVAESAAGLNEEGNYHVNLLAHEILGADVSDMEHAFHMKNLAEIIIFAILMLPYEIIFIRLMINIIRGAKKTTDKFKYIIVYLGALSMLPDYLIKVDYGRWIVSTIFYYLVVFAYLYIKDDYIKEQIDEQVIRIKGYGYIYILLLMYPLLFVPYRDVNIDKITAMIGHVLNRELLHWW